jgi:uncharacterized membrane protein
MTDTEAPSPADEAPEGEPAAEEKPEEKPDETPDDTPDEKPKEKPKEKADKRPDWWVRHYTFTGTAVGLVFLWLSMTPSLLPRGPLFQGLVSGAAGATGYALGVFAVWLVRFMLSKDTSPKPPKMAWVVLVVVGIVGQVAMIIWFHVWQDHVRDAIGVPRLTWHDYPLAAVLAIVALFVLVEIGQLVGRLIRFLVRQLNRVAPPRVSATVAVLLVVALFIAILNGVVLRAGMRFLNSTFESVNNEMSPDIPAPKTNLRSGGPGSKVKWAELGHQGRTFVASGPTVEELTKFNGTPATPPIRAYAGLESAPGIKATADLAAAELVGMGGLNRKVVAVATTTGTGWINEAEAEAIEYMFNGDTAIVSMQYSFLPSWLSFLVDKENARQAGQALFEAVSARVRALPEGQRPKLVVFGESLGSFGGEAPFLSVNNIVARTDGALFSGPTFNNTMWEEATRNRDKSSPEWLPIYQDGQNVRFSARPQNLARPAAPWGNPRIVYLQHASDPIAWWNPELLFSEPDWLREPAGGDRPSDMFWFPVVTFLQVSADMAVAVDVPDGHGHRYVRDVVNGWAQVLQPPGWTPEKTERLREVVKAPE